MDRELLDPVGLLGPGGPAGRGAQGFDDRFTRMWEYNLAPSEAGFATCLTQDLQIVMEKGRGLDA